MSYSPAEPELIASPLTSYPEFVGKSMHSSYCSRWILTLRDVRVPTTTHTMLPDTSKWNSSGFPI